MKPGISRKAADRLTARWREYAKQKDHASVVRDAVFRCITDLEEQLAVEDQAVRDRVADGVRRAQADGTHCGRPRIAIDLQPALALLQKDWSLNRIAKHLKISRATLRRRFREVGVWRERG